jgi:hypothetical protein
MGDYAGNKRSMRDRWRLDCKGGRIMADILIRGMEMPEYCYECPLHNMEGGYCQFYKDSYRWSFERPASCPLILLPEGHGDLIDRDALKKRTPMVIDYSAGGFGTDGSIRPVRGYGDWQIDQAPTIVPAEVTDIDVGNKKEGGAENE